jgi:TolC family type I secretion outer membrane protein
MVLGALFALAIAGAVMNSAAATTLEDALAAAYMSNPRLLAAQAELRSVDEGVAQARGEGRPTAFLTGEAGEQWSDSNIGASGWQTPLGVSIELEQPIYRGGSIEAGTERAENDVLAARARLAGIEQTVLGDAVVAFLDVVRDEAELALRENNEQVLVRQLQATQDRFEVGEVTRTDVSQAESRLALATAERIEAEGALQAALAFYQEVIGMPAVDLDEPAPLTSLPSSEQETVTLSEGTPGVIAAIYDVASARAAIDEEFGELLPRFSIVGRLTADDEAAARDVNRQSAAILAELTVPFYQGGIPDSRVRAAKQIASQRQLDLDTARRRAIQEATRAWQAYVTADATIDSFEAQVRATQLALEGVREEATVGARTVLDILDAEQEALDAQVSLIRARRNFLVAAYAVLQATGGLTADQIGLPVEYYDPEAHYRAVRDKIWGTDLPTVE